jgi:DNA-binding CsgD family transcriptional regulator/tetratricopeptide (TPR) repeat protein
MLLEREPSLASLAEYAQEARRGAGRLVLVSGEAGVGKTALVEQLQRDVPDARWSWGACDGLFTPRPLGPLFDVAERLGGELLERCRAGSAREALFGALLRQVGEPEMLDVVVIEDVHWADEATLDLLQFLGRRLRDASALLIASYRDDGLAPGDPLRAVLGELGTQRSTRRIALAPLSADAVRALAAGSELEADQLYGLTGGNPFFVTEVIEAGMAEVPASAREAVLARAARLGAESRGALDVAALTGSRIEPRVFDLVTGCAPVVVDELLASGLLAEDDGWLRFRHEIARLTVEQAIAAHRRGDLHARLLTTLDSLACSDEARMAFHAEGAKDGPAVLRYAPSAARRAAELNSHREAAAQFERALRFSAHADTVTVAGLYDELGREVALLDRWQDAADATQHALRLWRGAGDSLREGDAMLRHSTAMWHLCRRSDAVAAAETAVSILEPLPPTAELARAYSLLASQRMMEYEHDAAIALARQAQAIAQSLGAADVLSDALNTLGCSCVSSGGDWRGYLLQSLEIALAECLDAQAGRAYANLYSMYCSLRQFAEGERYFVAGFAYCDEHDITTYANCLRGEQISVLERTGQFDQSVALSKELLERANASPANRLCALTSIGTIRARRGEPAVWDYLDEAASYAHSGGEPQQIVAVQLARAEAHWLAGKLGSAARETELADDISARCDEWERGAIGVWLRRTGSDRQPSGLVAEPYRRELAGEWTHAARLWTELGCPYETGLALRSSKEEADLREALRIFTSLGAPAAARLTRQKMRNLGMRSIPAGPRSATRTDPLQLTPREREVLDLICSGNTNAQIAARLFISAKTVDHHVSAVLAKLDAPTRYEAASYAAKLGMVGAAEI